MRLPNLREGWLETEKGKITRRRTHKEKERIFILISLRQKAVKAEAWDLLMFLIGCFSPVKEPLATSLKSPKK